MEWEAGLAQFSACPSSPAEVWHLQSGVWLLSVPPTSRDRRWCPYTHPLSVPSPLLHPCWRAFRLSLHPVYCCTSQGEGMSLAQRVIFLPTWSSSRGSCGVTGEPQSQELLDGMSRMPFSLFSLLCYFCFCIRLLFFPVEILYGSTMPLLFGRWISMWSNNNRWASWYSWCKSPADMGPKRPFFPTSHPSCCGVFKLCNGPHPYVLHRLEVAFLFHLGTFGCS